MICTEICIPIEIASLQQYTQIQIHFENDNTVGERQVPNIADDY